MYLLTIAIPSIVSRREKFLFLKQHIQEQINEYGLKNEVEIIEEIDNKEISIGKKRDNLYKRATGLFTFMPDDDDMIPYHYCKTITDKIKEDNSVDCIGYLERCTTDGLTWGVSCFSMQYKEWSEKKNGILISGQYDHVRTPFFKSPIKTELCKQIGVKDMRFGEDHDFAKRIHPFLKSEAFIDDFMYEYRYKSEPHNQKYGIK